MISELNQHRRDFWAHFAGAEPSLYARTTRGNEHSRWLAVGAGGLIVALYLTNRSVGVFVRGERGSHIGHVRERLFSYRERLAQALRQPDIKLGDRFLLNTGLRLDMHDHANWPRASNWLAINAPFYQAALHCLLTSPAHPFEEPNPFL
jgi:hypothetical protein